MNSYKTDYKLDCLEYIAPREILLQYINGIVYSFNNDIIGFVNRKDTEYDKIKPLLDLIFKSKT